MSFLTNPWVIIAIVLAVVIGNIMALKYTANMGITRKAKTTDDLDELNRIDKKLDRENHKKSPSDSNESE
jgi:F0F1-type ATP synthase membrane subunit b/b'